VLQSLSACFLSLVPFFMVVLFVSSNPDFDILVTYAAMFLLVLFIKHCKGSQSCCVSCLLFPMGGELYHKSYS
jgi:hypothetical protein